MKTVLTNSEIPHLWANQTQPEARNSSRSFWFEGVSIYSCQTEMARIVGDFVLIGDSYYSTTTSQQQSKIRQACSHLTSVYIEGADWGGALSLDVAHNFEWMREKAQARIDSAFRRRCPDRRGWDLEAAKKVIEHARRLWDVSRGNSDFSNRPRQFPRVLLELGTTASDALESEDLNAKRKAWAERKAESKRKREEAKKRALAADLEKWKAGETGVSVFNHPETFLRVRSYRSAEHAFPQPQDEGLRYLETSKGVRVALSDALALFRFFRLGAKLIGQKVGGFTVTASDKEKVTIGCHCIKWSEAERVLGPIFAEEMPA